MTVLEQQFMQRMPSLLLDLIEETKKLRKEIAALREELKNKNENE